MTDPSPLHAQQAAEALIALGYPVQPTEDFEAWRIGDFLLSDAELLAFAVRRGVVLTGSEQ